jgi:structural maintenance of chromosome 1
MWKVLPARIARLWRGSLTGLAGKCVLTSAVSQLNLDSSFDLATAYEAARAAQDKATEASTSNYAKKRGILSEVKLFKEQKEEVRQWEGLRDSKVGDPASPVRTSLICPGRYD